MGLQVWLPLNGDMKNRGLAGDFTLSGTATYGSGKLGQAIYIDKTDNRYTAQQLNGVTHYSVAYWEKIDASQSFTQYADLWEIQTKCGGTTSIMREELRSSAGAGYCKVHMVKDTTVGTNTNNYYGIGSDSNRAKNKWAHVVIVKDDDYVYQYVNGVFDIKVACNLFESSPQALTGYFKIGENTTNSCPAWIQDFRIYDHCLSPREIKEISKGLVLHYPLSRGGFGQDNLIHDTANMSNTIWSYGSHASAISDENGKSVLLTGTDADWSSRIGSSYNTSNTSYFIPYSLIQNKQVTFSLWIKGNQNFNQSITFSLRTSNSASRTKYFTGGTVSVSTEWQRKSFTLTVTDSRFTDGSGTISTTDYFFVEIYNHVNNRNVWVRGLKLEYGDKVTPWTPNPADEIYSTMGLDDGIEYDVSGYQYNGEKFGNLTYSTNTSRYNTCYEFDGSTTYVRLKHSLYSILRLARDEVTMNIWAYKDNWKDYESNGTSSQLYTMCGCQEGGGISIYVTGNGRFQFICGTGETSNTYKVSATPIGYVGTLPNGWHMLTLTFDGFNLNGYVDGKLAISNAFFTTKTPIYYNTGTTSIYIGVESGSGKQAGYWWKGKLSDFRVYTTALSASDILELYHTPETLANNGTLLTQGEFVES